MSVDENLGNFGIGRLNLKVVSSEEGFGGTTSVCSTHATLLVHVIMG